MQSHRLAVGRLILQVHLALMAVALLSGDSGEALRLVAEQVGHLAGRGLTENAPDQFLVVLHLGGMAALASALWLWARMDSWTPRSMRVAAGAMLLLAPLGIPVALLLLWLSRHALGEAAMAMPAIAGQRRLLLSLGWIGGALAVFVGAFGAFILLEANLALWLPAMLASCLPGVAALLLMMGTRPKLGPDGMPALPKMHGSSLNVPDEAAEA